MISDCDKLSKSLGVPVVAVDGDSVGFRRSLPLYGRTAGEEEQAEKLASYAEKTLQILKKWRFLRTKRYVFIMETERIPWRPLRPALLTDRSSIW